MTGRSNVRDEISASWDGHDIWGSCLSNLFALCTVVHENGGDVPAEAEYKPALMRVVDVHNLDYPESVFTDMWLNGHVSMGDLEYWIRVMNRYSRLVPEDRQY